jgi:UDP-N-acetylglucosamine acyltransferase
VNIHPSSIIHESAKIDPSVNIGPFCVIGRDVEIQKGTSLLSHVVLKGPSVIGENNTIYQFSTIGENTPDKKFNGEDTKLIIGDNNIFREGVTIHRGTIQDKGVTEIGHNNLFMAYVHIAHDCIVGSNNVFANNAGLAGHVEVGSSVVIGAFSTVHQFCKLGDHSFAGMNASITMDIPAYIKAASNPARVVGLNSIGMSRNNISDESIALIKKAYKVFYRRNLKLDDALIKLNIMLDETADPCLNIFIESIKASERGILR